MKTNLYGELLDVYSFNSKQALTDLQQTQVKSILKKLNQRMTEFERQGLTNDSGYKSLKSLALALPHHENKAGNVRIDQSLKGLDSHQILRVVAASGNEATLTKTAMRKGAEVARQLNPGYDLMSPKQQKKLAKEAANEMGDLHDFIIHHTDAYYWTSNGGEIDLESAVHRGKGDAKLHVDELAYMLEVKHKYEAHDEELRKQISEWNRNRW